LYLGYDRHPLHLFSTKVSSQPKSLDLMKILVFTLSHVALVEKRLNEETCVCIKSLDLGWDRNFPNTSAWRPHEEPSSNSHN